MTSSQVERHEAIALQQRPVLGGSPWGQSGLQALNDHSFTGSDSYFGIVMNLGSNTKFTLRKQHDVDI